jgi:acyl carrier protein
MTIEEIIEKATIVLAEEFEVEEVNITPEASLKDTLGLDSLDLVDVVVLVEQHFGITLTGPDFIGVATFQDFYELLYRKINEQQ